MMKYNDNITEDTTGVICGRNPVIEALKSGVPQLDSIYINGSGGSLNLIRNLAKEKNIVVKDAQEQKLNQLSGGASHQGVVAFGACGEYVSVEDIQQIFLSLGVLSMLDFLVR